MHIICDEITIRDFERKDIPMLNEIINEKEIVRFMRDWSENAAVPGRQLAYIDWLQSQSLSTDVYENKRYAVVKTDTDELIGMVGMGLEDNCNEVEVAYFMKATCRRKGYTTRAVNALTDWCFKVSDLPYLILTIDCANTASCRTAKKCGFELFEKRTPIGHKQPNMESDSYYYFRKYRK